MRRLRNRMIIVGVLVLLVAAGFWSSRIGVADLGYLGNRPVMEWTGAPDAVVQRLGVG